MAQLKSPSPGDRVIQVSEDLKEVEITNDFNEKKLLPNINLQN